MGTETTTTTDAEFRRCMAIVYRNLQKAAWQSKGKQIPHLTINVINEDTEEQDKFMVFREGDGRALVAVVNALSYLTHLDEERFGTNT